MNMPSFLVRTSPASGRRQVRRVCYRRLSAHAETRTASTSEQHTDTGDPQPAEAAAPYRLPNAAIATARPRPNVSDPVRTVPCRAGPDLDLSGLDRTGLDEELVELGLTIATKVRMRGDALTREVLIDEIRGEGRTIGTDRASKLLKWIKIKMVEAAPAGAD
jgi:hypothetical protein